MRYGLLKMMTSDQILLLDGFEQKLAKLQHLELNISTDY